MTTANLHSKTVLRDLLTASGIPALVRLVIVTRQPSPATRTDPAPWELPTHPADPRERLTGYLDAWASMDESAWPEANVLALKEDIMDIFREYPEADAWYREWREKHPEGRLS